MAQTPQYLGNRYDTVSREQWETGSWNGNPLAGDRNNDQYYANYAERMAGFRTEGNFAQAEASNVAHGFEPLFAPPAPPPPPAPPVVTPTPQPPIPPTPSPQPSPQTQELQQSVSGLQQQIADQQASHSTALAEAKALAERMKPRDASKALNSTILTAPGGLKEKRRSSYLTPLGG